MEHINPVCLPKPGAQSPTLGTQECVSNGWGKDKFGDAGRYGDSSVALTQNAIFYTIDMLQY